jgi:hypothetical protein
MDLQAFQKSNFSSPQALKSYYDFYQSNYFTSDMNNEWILENLMPKEFYDFQKKLLRMTIDLHKKERNVEKSVKEIIHSHFTIKDMRDSFYGSYSLHNIYYLQASCDYFFVGDIHSDAFILDVILEKIDFFKRIYHDEAFKIVFLGDYIDRGHQHLKTLQNLMLLKVIFPENIYLLTGNHDIGHIENGDVTLYLKKVEADLAYFYLYINTLYLKDPNFDKELLELYLTFLNNLNIMTFIISKETCIKAVHGGIPRPDKEDNFDYITKHQQFTDESLDPLEFKIRDCVLWSDPSIQHNQPTLETKRFKFYENQLINFQDHLGIDCLVRGHQAMEDGYLELFNHRIYTVFSSGEILENNKNINTDTAYDFVMPKVLHYKDDQGLPMLTIDLNT